MSCDPVIVIHGGAWAVPDHLAEASRRGVRAGYIMGHEGKNTSPVGPNIWTLGSQRVIPGHNRSYEANTGQVRSGEVMLGQVRSQQVR